MQKISIACTTTTIGLLLVFGSFALLWCNESRSVEVYNMLQEARSTVRLYDGAGAVDPSHINTLVWVSGKLEGEVIKDDVFDVEVDAAIFQRNAEMLQWVERKHTTSGYQSNGVKRKDTTYTYEKAWRDTVVPSAKFHATEHNNPTQFPYDAQRQTAKSVHLGAFSWSKGLLDRVPYIETLQLHPPLGDNSSRYHTGIANAVVDASSTSSAVALPPRYHLNGNVIQSYHPSRNPEVGDVMIDFQVLPSGLEVSVIAKQNKDGLLSVYRWPMGKGRTVGLVAVGRVGAGAMLDAAERPKPWALRGAGGLLMFLGGCMAMSWLNTVATALEHIPVVGPAASGLGGLGTALQALVLACALPTLTLALAWLRTRPAWSLSAAVFVSGLLWWSSRWGEGMRRLSTPARQQQRRGIMYGQDD